MSERVYVKRLEELPPGDLLQETLRTGEKIARTEEIPIDRITSDVLIVDEEHVESLRQSIAGPRGQISEIVVRARIGGETREDIGYDIIDGFHRYEAIKAMGNLNIRAKVLYGCTDEEMYDLRILAANSVRSVKFSRLAYWMQGGWEQTPWRRKIKVVQAFSLAFKDSSGLRLGLPNEEAEAVKKWAKDKAEKWLMSVGAIHRMLLVMDWAAPDLIGQVRTTSGGRFARGGLRLTPKQLWIIAGAFPGEFDIQRELANYAVGRRATSDEISAMVKEIEGLEDPDDMEKVREALLSGRWREDYVPEKRKMTLAQLLGPLQAFRTQLSFYPDMDDEEKRLITRRIDALERRIHREQREKLG